MKPTKLPGLLVVIVAVGYILFPLLLLPVMVPPLAELLMRMAGVPAAVPVNLLLSIALDLLLVLVYWQTLEPMGRLLHSRELTILNRVTQEIE